MATIIHFQKSQLLGMWCSRKLKYPYHYSSTPSNANCLDCLRKAVAAQSKVLRLVKGCSLCGGGR